MSLATDWVKGKTPTELRLRVDGPAWPRAAPLPGERKTVNFNDAHIAQVFTTRTNGLIQDNTPNGQLNVPLPDFDVVVQIERGGGVTGSYTLALVAHDLSDGTTVPTYGFTVTNNFRGPQWINTGIDAHTQIRRTIPVDASRAGHVLRYSAVLVDEIFQITSFADSNHFFQQ